MKRFVFRVAILTSVAFILLLRSPAEANDTHCMGALIGTFDNVIVPPGQTCSLTDSTVWGNVKALEDSRLLINQSNIHGNVEADKAEIVQIFFSVVRQDISIKEGSPAQSPAPLFTVCGFAMTFTPCEVLVVGTRVEEGDVQVEKVVGSVLFQRLAVLRGNVKVEDNFLPAHEIFFLDNSFVAQNLQIFKNSGPGIKLVQGNTVDENLQCFENAQPFVARFNTARQAEGQCATAAVP